MSAQAPQKKSRRVLLLAGAALLWLVALSALVAVLRADEEGHRVAHAAEPSGASRRITARPAMEAIHDKDDADATPIVIDEITVEKREICAGEENLVTVRAHAAREEDAPELQIIIDGTPGSQVALRPTSYLGPDGTAPRVTAHLGDERRVSAEIPPFEVRDCHPERILDVRHRAVPNAPGRVELWANVVQHGPGEQFKPVRYRWELSDGTREETTTPIFEKSFRGRRQDALFTHVLVTCIAESADGQTLMGRTNIELFNQAYEILARKGTVLLEVDHPQFPELDEKGIVNWPIRVWHHHNAPVTITAIRRIRVSRDGALGAGGGREQIDQVPVESVLGTNRIPSGWIDAKVTLDTHADPDVAYVLYEMTGRTDDGYPAGGGFSVMRPTELPTREKHVQVADVQLMAKIIAAQKILGKQYVTDEDIWRLEREGKLDTATIDPADLPEHLPATEPGPKLGRSKGR
ncbi:MAG TPA: hypothetical protein VFV99_19915 [Kofleriaceae bacterium]|nr:hypothetical protein [Kofleriaceae bacterium]